MSGNHTFIDLFAGCGGLSLGLMLAGWDGLFAIERDAQAFDTLRCNLIEGNQGIHFNWPDWLPKEPYDINIFAKKYRKQIQSLRGKVDLIAGGLPCQGFSLAGRRNKGDPRNKLFEYYIKLVTLIRPPLLLLENVKGIEVEFGKKCKGKKKKARGRPPKPFSQVIKDALEKNGYCMHAGIVKAVDYGVPQCRPRYIMVGIDTSLYSRARELDPFELLKTMRTEFLNKKGLPTDRPIGVEEAISDLETKNSILIECIDSSGFKQIAYKKPKTYYQKMLHGSMNGTAPNSLRLARHREETQARFSLILQTCRRGVQLTKEDRKRLGINKHCIVPLHSEKPAPTLTTLPDDIIHYSEPRILTVRECARLQSFPDWYEFKGNYTTGGERRVKECPRYTQVGNAVPPFLAEILGLVLDNLKQKIET